MAQPCVSKCLFRIMLQKDTHWSGEMLTVLSGEGERLGAPRMVPWFQLPSNVGDAVQCLARDPRSHRPHSQKTKTQKKSNTVTN